MQDEIDPARDRETPQEPPTPPLPPPVKRNEDNEGREVKASVIDLQKKKTKHWLEYVEPVCAVLLVCITAYYAYYARQQWVEAQKTANAAICAARISADALKLSRQEFSSSQAAVLQPNVSIRDVGKGAFVQIDIINSGHIAATRVSGEIALVHRPTLRITDATVSSHSAAPDYQSGFITRTIKLDVPNDPKALASQHLKVKISLDYWNGVDRITSSFCYGLTVNPYTGAGDWHDCENQETFQQEMR